MMAWSLTLATFSFENIVGCLKKTGVANPLSAVNLVARLSVFFYLIVICAAVVCFSTWAIIEKTSLGATLRAATENAPLVQAFGVDVPRVITLTYGGGVALAAFAGVLAAPIYSVNPNMGDNFINTVFAVVVIGGMGSILGAIISGFALGVIEGLTKVFFPQFSATVIFLVMVVVLLTMPRGLFGKRA